MSITAISNSLCSPSLLHIPKQSYRKVVIPREETSATPKNWNLIQRAAAMALDIAEEALLSHELKFPLSKTSDPRVQIAGNFAPVPVQPVRRSLPVTETIPDCIKGVYLRNGANPLLKPVAGHHFFDGDGMVHAVTIDSGNASYSCRFTEIPLEIPTMMHDFAITENFVVIPDQRVVFKLQEMIGGGSPVVYDEKKKSRFGVLPKYARDSSKIVWIESESMFCFHLWNAWEEPELQFPLLLDLESFNFLDLWEGGAFLA